MTRRVLSAALDGEASPDELVTAARHLGRCPRCRRFSERMAAVVREIRASSADLAAGVGSRDELAAGGITLGAMPRRPTPSA